MLQEWSHRTTPELQAVGLAKELQRKLSEQIRPSARGGRQWLCQALSGLTPQVPGAINRMAHLARRGEAHGRHRTREHGLGLCSLGQDGPEVHRDL